MQVMSNTHALTSDSDNRRETGYMKLRDTSEQQTWEKEKKVKMMHTRFRNNLLFYTLQKSAGGTHGGAKRNAHGPWPTCCTRFWRSLARKYYEIQSWHSLTTKPRHRSAHCHTFKQITPVR